MNIYANSADELLAGVLEKEHNRGYGLIINLSKLEEQHRTPEAFSIAQSMMRNRLKSATGDIFSLPHGDIIIIYDGSDARVLEETIKELRYLYADDPLAYSQGGVANDNFSSVFPLSHEWQKFADACQERLSAEATIELPENQILPVVIQHIENTFNNLDFTSIIRSNYIYEKHGDTGYRKYLQEFFIDHWQLEMQINQPTDIFDNRHLNAFATKILDIRLLIQILNSRMQMEGDSKGFFLKLSADTVCSEEFELFNSALESNSQDKITIAIASEEIYRRDGLWQQAQEILQKQGYKICVDEVRVNNFFHLDRKAIGADLVRLLWDNQISSDGLSTELSAKIQTSGTKHIIMQGCNSQEAMDFCRNIGISLFSGGLCTAKHKAQEL